MEIFLSSIGIVLTFITVCFSLILFFKSEDEYIVFAYEHLQSLDSYLSQLVSFAQQQVEISNQNPNMSYNDFMLKTRMLNCYLPYFIYKQDFSVLNQLAYVDEDISSRINDKTNLCTEIRQIIFDSRNTYRDDNNEKVALNSDDVIHFRTVYSVIRGKINEYQKEIKDSKERKRVRLIKRIIKVLLKEFPRRKKKGEYSN